mmetsp:Transcript_32135/g.41317  ORF Transcript_32135/g.41317 Transcript_32135/m.41317 type:complete len:212 (+) Transcript_32135:91-726(+)
MIKLDEGNGDEQNPIDFYAEWEVNSTAPCKLFVRNKQDEFIANVKGIGSSWWPESITITHYCRDPSILSFRPNQTVSSTSFFDTITGSRMCCFDSNNHLSGFAKFLKDSGKAACADDKINALHYFIIPGDKVGEVLLMRKPMRRTNTPAKPTNGGQPKKTMSLKEQTELLRQRTKEKLIAFINSPDEDSVAFEPMSERGLDLVMGEVSVRL